VKTNTPGFTPGMWTPPPALSKTKNIRYPVLPLLW